MELNEAIRNLIEQLAKRGSVNTDNAPFAKNVLPPLTKEDLFIKLREIEDMAVGKSKSVLKEQHGGDHYKTLGAYQPWEVLKAWLTPEEFRGFMKGTAIAYLAREQQKGGDLDIKKATHTLEALIELMEVK